MVIDNDKSRAAGRYRLLAHTADIGLAVVAPRRSTLFATAAQGLLALCGCAPAPRPLERRSVAVAGEDNGELLIAWLNELLYQQESCHFAIATVQIETLTTTRLSATLFGEPLDPERHSFAHQVKAATYHRLVVRERRHRWQGRLYVDL